MGFIVFLLTVWIFAEWVMRRRDRDKNDQRFSNIISVLNRAEKDFQELKRLTARVAELEKQAAARGVEAPGSASSPAATVATAGEDSPVAPIVTSEISAPSAHEPFNIAAAPAASADIPSVVPPTLPQAMPIPEMSSRAPAGASDVASSSSATAGSRGPVSRAPLSFASAAHAANSPKRNVNDIEQILGTNWLNKIGIAALVIGIALFLAYKFPTLTNPEKVGLGYAVSFAILGLGVFLERKDRYRLFARALIGGGWALVYFTTYAMHFVQYTRVVDNEEVDLVLLFAVAWAMVWHTLHYNSQVVTGLAFLLGFTTVAISENTVYCLTAGAILAFGIVVIVQRRGWFELEVFGLVASYVNHYIWLRSVIEPMGSARHMFPEFWMSTALLCTYWALYRWSYIARKIQRETQEHVSTVAAVLNTALLLFLFKYQSVRPALAFYALLALGAIELTLGQLPVTRKRRTAMVILSTIGIVLLVAAVPFKYSGMGTAVLWLAQTEILLIVGIMTGEKLFRRFGFLAVVLTTGDLIVFGAAPVFGERMGEVNLLHSPADYRLGGTFLLAALLFLADAEWVPRKWKNAVGSEFEGVCFRMISYLGGLALFIGLWLAFPNLWTATVWAGAAAALAILGRAASADDLSYQAQGMALGGFLGTLFVNVGQTSNISPLTNLFLALSRDSYAQVMQGSLHIDAVFVTIVLVTGLLYTCAYFSGPKDSESGLAFSAIHTWAAAILLLALTLREMAMPWVTVTWAAFGLLLMFAALKLKRADFYFQAILVSAMTVVLAVTVNLHADSPFALIPQLSLRLVTMVLTAACLYVTAEIAPRADAEGAAVMGRVYAWAGTILVWALLLFELQPLHVALGWAIFGLALFECGILRNRFMLRLQSYLVFLAAMARVFIANVNASPHDLLFTTLPLAIVFYYVYWRTETKQKNALVEDQKMFAGALVGYFGTAIVATVLYCALRPGWIAAGWASLALALIGIAWTSRHYIFLHHSLLLAVAVLVRTLFFDLVPDAVTNVAVLDSRAFQVGVCSALLFFCMVFAFPLRKRLVGEHDTQGMPDFLLPVIVRPEQAFFFLPLIQVTALIAREVSGGRVTMAWGVVAVAVFLFALIVGERSFRLTGLGLLLLCVGKILALDVWQQNKADRFATFILLGVALLLVSYLYTRYNEMIRRYL